MMNTYRLTWGLTGQHIADVRASEPRNAMRKVPMPYRKYHGEVRCELVSDIDGMTEFERSFKQSLEMDTRELERDIAKHGIL